MRRGLRVQDRDIAILWTLGHVSLLDTPVIHGRFFPNDRTGEACRRRLRLLVTHGLVQVIHLDVARTTRTGRLPSLYRLTERGALLVEDATGCLPLRFARSDVPKRLSTLLHRLGTARLVLAVDDACGRLGLEQPEWFLEYDVVPGAANPRTLAERFRLCHRFPDPSGDSISCWPDAACRLSIERGGRSWRLVLLWEYDRSTETHAQLSGTKPSHGNGKLDGYRVFLDARTERTLWDEVDAVRVLFVVPSEQRLVNVGRTFADHETSDVVRLAVEPDVVPECVLTESIWRTTEGERRAILPN